MEDEEAVKFTVVVPKIFVPDIVRDFTFLINYNFESISIQNSLTVLKVITDTIQTLYKPDDVI